MLPVGLAAEACNENRVRPGRRIGVPTQTATPRPSGRAPPALHPEPGVESVESRLDLISTPFGAGDDRGWGWRREPCTPPNHVVFRWPIICGSSGLTSFEVRFFGR
jgi:hypothetical protein